MTVAGVGAAESGRERALGLALLADGVMLVSFLWLAIASGSLSLAAEVFRGGVLTLLGVWAFRVMCQVHRGTLSQYDFGTGKLEQFANLLVALGMMLGAAWVLWRAGLALANPPQRVARLMLAGTFLSGVNLMVNALAFLALWRTGRDGTSVVMRGQIRSRAGKLMVSTLVTTAIAVAALAPDTLAGRYADAAGALLVVAVMLTLSISLFRTTLPDLLDRTLAEGRQAVINRVLGRYFDDYQALGAVRSRQAGNTLHVEVTLGFLGTRPFAEVAATARSVGAALEEALPGAQVVVIPVAT